MCGQPRTTRSHQGDPLRSPIRTNFRRVAVAPHQDDRKGSSLLEDGSAHQARGDEVLGLPQSWDGAGNPSLSPEVGAHGRSLAVALPGGVNAAALHLFFPSPTKS